MSRSYGFEACIANVLFSRLINEKDKHVKILVDLVEAS